MMWKRRIRKASGKETGGSMATVIIAASDNHGNMDIVNDLIDAYPQADLFVHCGDLEGDFHQLRRFVAVRGNNDWDYNIPEQRIIRVKNHKILLVHSHQFPYSLREKRMAKRAKELGCDIVIYGHTHVGDQSVVDGVTMINPGSMRLPRDGKSPSYAVITIEDDGEIHTEWVHKENWPFFAKKEWWEK
jgi:hypothetical protein